ncbi:MAG: hypothetical protein ACKPKO_08590, partial [Candidatus Fonsibacter sp.]
KKETTDAMNAGQTAFKQTVHKFLNGPTKSLVLKSIYGSSKTKFMQRLINKTTIPNGYYSSHTGKH